MTYKKDRKKASLGTSFSFVFVNILLYNIFMESKGVNTHVHSGKLVVYTERFSMYTVYNVDVPR